MNLVKRCQVLPASILKIVAVISMTIDHFAAAVLEFWYLKSEAAGMPYADQMYRLYYVMRCIGRLAFPIYCFLLVEGFFHTRSKAKYARNLAIFALVSEIPFDLAFWHARWFTLDYQNVFFTLLFGFLAMLLMQLAWEKIEPLFFRIFTMIAIAIFFLVLAEVCHTDYGGWGVLTVVLMYALRSWRVAAGAAGCTVLTLSQPIEGWTFCILPLLALYNGKRGKQRKFFFYIYYPAHLLILYLVYRLLVEPMIL